MCVCVDQMKLQSKEINNLEDGMGLSMRACEEMEPETEGSKQF